MTISRTNFEFLRELGGNNDREWFNANKDRYAEAHENAIGFTEAVLAGLSRHDNLVPTTGKKALQRIYRDTRFAADKTPYKTHWGGGFARATAKLRGGYYFHVGPDDRSFVAGGFWRPNPADLLHIRKQVESDSAPLRKILRSVSFRSTFGELGGEKVKTAPKGFARDHADVDLLRHKSFIVSAAFDDDEVLSESFPDQVVSTFRLMRPFFDYMSEILTTDLNGEPLVGDGR